MLSVIIPSYKPQQYIYKCLDSVWNQTIAKDRYEVIIVLNGDREPYFTEVTRYVSKYPNFSCVYNAVKGVSAARNLGLNIAVNSRFVVFVDDDDYISLNYLENLYDAIVDTDSEIVQSNFKIDVDGEVHDDYISRAFIELHLKQFDLVSFRRFFSSVCGKIYKREFISKFRFYENVAIAEDAIFLFTLSRSLTKFGFSSIDCVYYRYVREGSTVRSHRSFFEILKNYFVKIFIFSSIYLRDPIEYSFPFYLTRILAITKMLYIELRATWSHRN